MTWVSDLYTIPTDDGIDLLFDKVNRLLTDGDFVGCDAILRSLDIKRLSIDMLQHRSSLIEMLRSRSCDRAYGHKKIRAEIRFRDPDRFQRLKHSIE